MGVQFFFLGGGVFLGRILGIFRPFSVTNERPEISALFPGKRADFSFSAWAEGGGRRADFTEGLCECSVCVGLPDGNSTPVRILIDGTPYWPI